MPNQLTISAIVPLYNGAKYVEEALNSILAQTREPDEIIVVDDGSTDNGPSIVKRIATESRVVLVSKPNGGQSSARNFGVAHSSGDLIALLDQDDAWYPNHLERLANPFGRPHFPELGWVYSNLDEMDAQGGMIRRYLLSSLPATHPKRDLIACLRQDMFVVPSATLISRKAFDTVGGFDERLTGYEDDDLFLRLFRAGYDNIFIDKPLSKWRIYPGSTSYSPLMARSRMIYASKLLEAYPNDHAQARLYARDLIAPRFLNTLAAEHRRAATAGNHEMAAALLNDLDFISQHLAIRKRTVIRAVLPFMRTLRMARTIHAARPILRPITRLVLN